MSQFDAVSFLGQILWFIIFFIGSYYIMMRYILPEIYISLKVREWRMRTLEKEKENMEIIFGLWNNMIKNIYSEILRKGEFYLKGIVIRRNFFIDFCKNTCLMGIDESGAEHVEKMKEIIIRSKILK
jgi:hypothetical protein